MSLILDGSNGLSDVDGTAATPAIRGTDTNTGIFFPAADTIAFSEGGTESARFDSSGNLGIGTTSPTQKLQATGADASGFTGIRSQNSNGGTGLAGIEFSSDPTYTKSAIAQLRQNANGNGPLVFYVDSASDAANWSTGDEKMRLDQSGNLLVDTTDPSINGKGVAINSQAYLGEAYGRINIKKTFSGNVTGVSFSHNNSSVGSITYSNTATAYNTSSDYRLKENIAPMTGALDKVSQLKPVTYKWKIDGSESQGFIAHELQAVVPDCVTGKKDAVDAEGKPIYQGIDTSFLVATLTAAIQELKATVDAQAARIAALESAV